MKAVCQRPGCGYELELDVRDSSTAVVDSSWTLGADGILRRRRRRGNRERRAKLSAIRGVSPDFVHVRTNGQLLFAAAESGFSVQWTRTVPLPLHWQCTSCRAVNVLLSST